MQVGVGQKLYSEIPSPFFSCRRKQPAGWQIRGNLNFKGQILLFLRFLVAVIVFGAVPLMLACCENLSGIFMQLARLRSRY